MRFISRYLVRPLLLVALTLGGALVGITAIQNAVVQMSSAASAERATIVRAVDGDTLLVRTGGREERVRLLGIDTPETVKPGAAVQRCGPEASARAKSWTRAHPAVRLTSDPAAPNRDRYGRLLRYVQPTGAGRDLSTVQVAAGLARVKAYGQDLKKLRDLRRAQTRAKDARRGIWGTTCATP